MRLHVVLEGRPPRTGNDPPPPPPAVAARLTPHACCAISQRELQTRVSLMLLGIACFPMTETITLQVPVVLWIGCWLTPCQSRRTDPPGCVRCRCPRRIALGPGWRTFIR